MARKTRTPQSVSPIDAVSALLADRAKYEQWLDELEVKKESTPPKVYERVQQDYLGRLQAVMDMLKQHTATLQAHGQSLNKRLIELASVEESRNEERSEAELRAKVGEMTPAEWEIVSKRADKELAKLKQDKAVIEEELERIENVLEDLTGGDGGDVGDKKPDAGAKKQVDELEFLKSIVGTGPRPVAIPPAPRSSGERAPKAATPSAGTPATPAPEPAAAAPPIPPTPPAPPPPAPSPASSAPTPVSSPAQPAASPAAATLSPAAAAKATPPAGIEKDPGPSVSEQPKTLKCQECGTMNYPSEWYCERCGAELTVV